MKNQTPVDSRLAFRSVDPDVARVAGDGELLEPYREIAALSVLLREQEKRCEVAEVRANWLREVAAALLTQPSWWALMPAAWHMKRLLKLLRSRGLFDDEAYLRQYPDVAATRMNPLQHFLLHGIQEGRPRSVPQV